MRLELPIDDHRISFDDRRYLSVMYGEAHRKYHNAPHTGHVFGYINLIRKRYYDALRDTTVRDLFNVLVSAWHDIIYTIGAKDNEAQSALAFRNSSTAGGLPLDLVNDVCLAIQASADHCNSINDMMGSHIKVFLDADLYELSGPYEIFHHNALNILAEYNTKYSMEECLAGREAWYRSMLEKERIFWICTDRDDLVRANVERGLKEICKCKSSR